jgi:hypothetical protein
MPDMLYPELICTPIHRFLTKAPAYVKIMAVFAGEPAVPWVISFYEFLHAAYFVSARLGLKQGIFFFIKEVS